MIQVHFHYHFHYPLTNSEIKQNLVRYVCWMERPGHGARVPLEGLQNGWRYEARK